MFRLYCDCMPYSDRSDIIALWEIVQNLRPYVWCIVHIDTNIVVWSNC